MSANQIDYAPLLSNYNPELVSSCAKIVDDVLGEYRARIEEQKIYSLTIAELGQRLSGWRDRFLYDMLSQGAVGSREESEEFVREKFKHMSWGIIKSDRETAEFVVKRYSKPGDITYEVGSGYSALVASIIHETTSDREKIFLVDPESFAVDGDKFHGYGKCIDSYVESFRKEEGGLVTDVVKKDGGFGKIQVPQADTVYANNILPFVDSESSIWNKPVYRHGYLKLADFVGGLRNIVKDNGRVVLLDHVVAIDRAKPTIFGRFELEEQFGLHMSGAPEENYIFGFASFRPK